MADSLVIGNIIELLGGGVASTHPLCAGAMFRLAPGWDLSAPQVSGGTVASLLLGGGLPVGQHIDNRQPKLPVVIIVPPTGDQVADRATLAGAREVLAQAVSADRWQMTWTRDGSGLPMIFDCLHASSVVRSYSEPHDLGLVSEMEISFEAMPYGKSDVTEPVPFNSPATGWLAPPSPVPIDDYTTAANFLTVANRGFEAGTGTVTWTAAGGCSAAVSAAQARSGTQSLALTCTTAGNMQAASCTAANVLTQGIAVTAGNPVTATAWLRAAATARSVNVGLDFYDSAGTVVGSTLRGSNVTNTTTGWTQATATVTAPAGAVIARVNVQVISAALSEVHYADDVTAGAPATSTTQTGQWSQSSQAAVGSHSARWVRSTHTAPLFSAPLAAVTDITGRQRLSLWVGLGTATYSTWHLGRVTCAVTLTDGGGNRLTVSITFTGRASGLPAAPRWQKISGWIPTVAWFDYTTITSYSVTLWNKTEASGPVLQADCYLDTPRADPASTGSYGARGTMYALPGVTGTAPAPLTVQLQPGPSAAPQTALFTTQGSNNWTAPTGVTSVQQVEVVASSAGGAPAGGKLGGGGGGGPEHVFDFNVPVTPAVVYHPFVGAPGGAGSTGVPATAGGDSYFTGDTRQVRAHGGQPGGGVNSWTGGQGGTGSLAPLHFDGGDGATTATRNGGGGGGAGGNHVNGSDGSGTTPGAAVDGGGPGGPGGIADGAAGVRGGGAAPTGAGIPGGGGGGGGLHFDGTQYGGAVGRTGLVRLTWAATAGTPLKTAVLHLPSRGSPNSIAPLIVAGNGTDTPNGGTVYNAPVTGGLQARYDGTYQVILANFSWNTPTAARTVTVTVRQTLGGGTTVTQALARTLTPSTDPDPLRVLNGLVLLGTVTLPLVPVSHGNNTDVISVTVNDTNTLDRFLDVLLLDVSGQTIIYSTAGAGLANLWVTEPDIGLDYGQVYGSAADWDTADSVLADVPVMAGGPLAVMPGENPLLAYSVQGAPGITASYIPRWYLDRLQ